MLAETDPPFEEELVQLIGDVSARLDGVGEAAFAKEIQRALDDLHLDWPRPRGRNRPAPAPPARRAAGAAAPPGADRAASARIVARGLRDHLVGDPVHGRAAAAEIAAGAEIGLGGRAHGAIEREEPGAAVRLERDPLPHQRGAGRRRGSEIESARPRSCASQARPLPDQRTIPRQ